MKPRIATAGLGRARSTVATLAVLSIVGLGGCSTLSSWLPSWLAEPPSWPSWLSFGHNAHKPGPLPAFEAKATARARELADQGYLERLWALPGQGRALGLYRARDSAEMEAIVKALPLNPWMTTELTPLTPHPSDPATMST